MFYNRSNTLFFNLQFCIYLSVPINLFVGSPNDLSMLAIHNNIEVNIDILV